MMANENPDYSKCLAFLRPNEEWSLNANDIDSLIWHSDTTPPTKEELDAVWSEAKAFFAAKYQSRVDAKNAVLEKLGITQEEARILLS
jgi:hypothetical protein